MLLILKVYGTATVYGLDLLLIKWTSSPPGWQLEVIDGLTTNFGRLCTRCGSRRHNTSPRLRLVSGWTVSEFDESGTNRLAQWKGPFDYCVHIVFIGSANGGLLKMILKFDRVILCLHNSQFTKYIWVVCFTVLSYVIWQNWNITYKDNNLFSFNFIHYYSINSLKALF